MAFTSSALRVRRSRTQESGVMPLAYWVHDLSPFLFKFSENFGIRYYGLAYLVGFFAAGWLLHRYHKAGRSPFPMDAITDLMTYIIVGTLVGGRLGYFLLYQFDTLRSDPLTLLRVWEGGMASHGGMLGVVLAMWLWARKRKVSFFQVSDLIVTVAPVGLLFGRIANFINGELYGKVTTFSWGVIFPQSAAPGTPISEIPPRHASQLYEAALEGALLLAFIQWRFWRTNVTRERPGRLSGEFLIVYAILRVTGEIFREPDASLFFGVSRGIFYSLFLIVAGVLLLRRATRSVQP
jgi:phosphatidylglycerol:prolipoprotein diacylglycerol transferase